MLTFVMLAAVISDSSCFIALLNIGRVEILRAVYGHVITTPVVAQEVGRELPDWVELRQATDSEAFGRFLSRVDRGEASAIALALEFNDVLVVLDDLPARNLAKQLGLSVTGTVGVIIQAKRTGILPSIKPVLDELKKASFRLSDDVIDAVLRSVGE